MKDDDLHKNNQINDKSKQNPIINSNNIINNKNSSN